MALIEKVQKYTAGFREKGLLRIRCLRARDASIYFDCNDYLSISHEPCIAKSYQEGFKRYSAGSTGSMVVSGYHHIHNEFEKKSAQYLQTDVCILFPSGYAANLAVTSLIAKLGVNCLIDKAIHASVYDGFALSKARYSRFNHNDIEHIAKRVEETNDAAVLFTEGIYSMSGQVAPLKLISSMIIRKEMALVVDESHSFGVMGCAGLGAVSYWGLSQQEVPLRIIPLGKAVAGQGALVAGEQHWIEALLHTSRSLIYSTALSPAYCYGLMHALDFVIAADARRKKLFELVELFRECIQSSPLKWVDSSTQIQFLHIGCSFKALEYAKLLKQNGFVCTAIRTPTVSKSDTGIRFVLNYAHREEDILRLFQLINRIYDNSSD